MKLNVGDYVRTKDYRNIRSRIGKIIKQDGKYYYLDIDEDTQMVWEEDTILKSSQDKIDLIEVGDYVNGLLVDKNKYGELFTAYVYYGGDIGKQCEVYTTWLKDYREDMIERIVTKEQFEQIEYKVGN